MNQLNPHKIIKRLKTMILFSNKLWKYLFLTITTVFFLACGPIQSDQSLEGQQTRTIEHAMGTTEVPQEPKRVVAIDTSALEHSITLNAPLVGGATTGTLIINDESGFPEEVKVKARQLTSVGTPGQPSLEVILSLEPDLILGNKDWQEDIYSKLSQIAPTVFTAGTGPYWKGNLPKHAEALGKSKQGEEVMEEYYQRLETLQAEMGEKLNNTKVALVRFRPSNIRFYMKDSFRGLILEDAGIARPEVQAKNKSYENVSFEEIPNLNDADVILFTEDDDSIKERVTNHPLWSKLEAVQKRRVYELSDRGSGILSAHLFIDDLFKYLLD